MSRESIAQVRDVRFSRDDCRFGCPWQPGLFTSKQYPCSRMEPAIWPEDEPSQEWIEREAPPSVKIRSNVGTMQVLEDRTHQFCNFAPLQEVLTRDLFSRQKPALEKLFRPLSREQ